MKPILLITSLVLHYAALSGDEPYESRLKPIAFDPISPRSARESLRVVHGMGQKVQTSWPSKLGLSDQEFPYAAVNSVFVQADGKLILDLGIYDRDYSFLVSRRILRVRVDGSIDPDFPVREHFPTVAGGRIYTSSVPLPDGGLLVTTREIDANRNITTERIDYRLRADGSIDEAFPKIVGSGFYAMTLRPLPDGKILVYSGEGVLLNGQRMPLFFRLNANGERDAGFTSTVDVLGGLDFQFRLLADGKLLVGAWGDGFESHFRLRRLHADGSLDDSFKPPAELFPRGTAPRFEPLPDGRILEFSRALIRRINLDGSVDGTFSAHFEVAAGRFGSGINSVQALSDGRFLVLGYFKSFNGVTAHGIARLESDGALDATFLSGSGLGVRLDSYPAEASQAWLVSGGRFLVTGNFDTYAGQDVSQPLLLKEDGTRDSTFVAPGNAHVIQVIEGGLIVWTPQGLDRLSLPSPGTSQPSHILSLVRDTAGSARLLIEAQAGRRYTLQATDDFAEWIDLDSATASGETLEFGDASTRAARFYRVRRE